MTTFFHRIRSDDPRPGDRPKVKKRKEFPWKKPIILALAGELAMPNTVLNRHTWVVVADGEKALFLRNENSATHAQLSTIHQMHQQNPATREQGSDKPGRFSDGVGAHRSAMDDTDWHEISKRRFAKEIADELYVHAHKRKFERLVLVAPPTILGELRQELHKEVLDKIVSEIPKTLTNHSMSDIQAIVEES
ncbi:host attachment family protein [Phyllobacterium endophyticum]|uniref:host attachment family protein n=1 Tax=Phyllobacterium endophyticum TaxID=1149773 RepID=UPI0031B9C0C4